MAEITPTYPRILLQPDATHEQVYVPLVVETPPDPPDPPDPTPHPPRLVVECQGVAHHFTPEDGEELDPYSDPQGEFVQRNIVCRNGDLPDLLVFYRPDAFLDREEWVIELGSWPGPQANMPAYLVEITCKNGDLVQIEANLGHYWFGRWRWQSEPRPIRTGYETLAAQHLIPYLDADGLTDGPLLATSPYTPMATCGFPGNQGSTGGYPGLGLITGWQAQYLVRDAPEDTIRDQGEAGNSYPVFVRDPTTYSPLDLVSVWPNATMYASNSGNPYIPKGPSPLRTDHGHLPSGFYVPFLLTGDPYLLEGMMFTCNYQQLSLPSTSRFMIMGRYWAWPSRAIAELVACCPASVPGWMLPRSYWQHWLDVSRSFVEDRAANMVDPYYYVFHTILESGQATDLDPSKSGDHVWQQGMVDLVASWIATWNDSWIEPAEWCIQSSIARASATSGWVRSRPAPYHMRLSHTSVLQLAMDKASATLVLQYPQIGFAPGVKVKVDSEVMVLGTQTDDAATTWQVTRAVDGTVLADHPAKRVVYGPKYLSWCEASQGNVDTYDWVDTGDNAHLSPNTTDLTYPSYQRAALAQALTAGLGSPGLQEAYSWLDSEIRRLVVEEDLPVGDNWCVVPKATRRRIHRRSDASDPQLQADLQALVDSVRQDEEHDYTVEHL